MHFIVMDLIGKFKLSPITHQHILSLIDMINYSWCIPLYTKESDKVVHTYLSNINAKFGGSNKIQNSVRQWN